MTSTKISPSAPSTYDVVVVTETAPAVKAKQRTIAIAVAKDTVTMLAELEEDDIDFPKTGETVPMESFKEILKKLKNKNTDGQ